MTNHAALAFASPRLLPKVDKLVGRVVVIDVAFAATVGTSVSYEQTTLPFITGLGDRLAAWIDHHDHERHLDWRNDERFVLWQLKPSTGRARRWLPRTWFGRARRHGVCPR